MTQPLLTLHAEIRANQRGVTRKALDAVMDFADLAAPVGGGCTAIRLSRERLADRDLRASLGRCADRLGGLTVLVADDTGQVVTILRDAGGAAGRRYRRPH